MPISEARRRANEKYNAKAYDQNPVPREKGPERGHSGACGEPRRKYGCIHHPRDSGNDGARRAEIGQPVGVGNPIRPFGARASRAGISPPAGGGNGPLRAAGALRLAKSRRCAAVARMHARCGSRRGETRSFSPLANPPSPFVWEQVHRHLPEDLRHLLPQIRAR